MILALSDSGERFYLDGRRPRMELLARLKRKHAEKFYVYKKDGKRVHIGYTVAGQTWIFYSRIEWPAGPMFKAE